MEDIEKRIDQFLSSGSGYGDGSGDGYGDGSGDGYGSGDGDGDGYGYGSGDGSGYGSGSGYGDGDGYGIGRYRGRKVYYVDGVRTIIDEVRGQFAMGWIIRGDLTLEKCWIARVGNSFAHGKNIHEAHVAALDKAMERMPEEERIDQFVKAHPSMEVKYSGEDLFKWHHILTGSCEMGRRAFCQDRGIDVVTSSYTVEEFIRLTCASYGSEIIRKLADRLSIMI